MKIAVFSDIHDNLARLSGAIKIIKAERIEIGICCGDVSMLETLAAAAKPFQKLYLCFGNMDVTIKNQTGLFPENVIFWEKEGEFELAGKKIAIVHHDYIARDLAKSQKYDLVFYGHTHTPWEKKVGKTIMLNPGEISGQFGPASFALFDITKMKASLRIIP